MLVEGNPFSSLSVSPWLEERELVGAETTGQPGGAAEGHAGWTFPAGETAEILLTLADTQHTEH